MESRKTVLVLRKLVVSLSLMAVVLWLAGCPLSPQATTSPEVPPIAATAVTPADEVAPAMTQAAVMAAKAAAKATEAAARSTIEAAATSAAATPTAHVPAPTATAAPTPTPSPTTVPSPTPTPVSIVARVTADTLNVRGGPGTNYPRQGQVQKGDPLTVLECNAERDWIHVRLPDSSEGWVAVKLTDVGSAVNDVAVARSIPPTPKVVARPGMIAFKSNRGGIWIMNADGSNQQPLANTSIYYNALRRGGLEYCAKNGLYCVKADRRSGHSDMDVFVEDREYGTGWHNIVSNNHIDWDPRMHPDGWWVVFVTNRNGNDELFLISREVTEERRLTINDWQWDKHPSWSPDGKLIAFFSNRVTGRRQIWILDPNAPFKENVNPYNISNNPYLDYEPVWLK